VTPSICFPFFRPVDGEVGLQFHGLGNAHDSPVSALHRRIWTPTLWSQQGIAALVFHCSVKQWICIKFEFSFELQVANLVPGFPAFRLVGREQVRIIVSSGSAANVLCLPKSSVKPRPF
jgi:hypothetical protein